MAEKQGLLERLEQGPVICAEGYLFELERRGYLQAGAFVPEVVLEHPELVAQLHREFVHAGSDVVEAFTYYAHREKLKIIDKEHLLEEMNRGALAIAKEVADDTGALLAGNICNTNVFVGDDASRNAVRGMFEEQVAWAVEADVDFVIGETFGWGEEALIALDVIKAAGLPAVITLRDPSRGRHPGRLAGRRTPASGSRTRARTSSGSTASAGLGRCCRCSRAIRSAVTAHVAALPVPYRTTEDEPSFAVAQGSRL